MLHSVHLRCWILGLGALYILIPRLSRTTNWFVAQLYISKLQIIPLIVKYIVPDSLPTKKFQDSLNVDSCWVTLNLIGRNRWDASLVNWSESCYKINFNIWRQHYTRRRENTAKDWFLPHSAQFFKVTASNNSLIKCPTLICECVVGSIIYF